MEIKSLLPETKSLVESSIPSFLFSCKMLLGIVLEHMQASSSSASATPVLGSHDELYVHHLRTLKNILELDFEPLNKLWLIQDIVNGWAYTLPRPGSVVQYAQSRGQKRVLGGDKVLSPGGYQCSCVQQIYFQMGEM